MSMLRPVVHAALLAASVAACGRFPSDATDLDGQDGAGGSDDGAGGHASGGAGGAGSGGTGGTGLGGAGGGGAGGDGGGAGGTGSGGAGGEGGTGGGEGGTGGGEGGAGGGGEGGAAGEGGWGFGGTGGEAVADGFTLEHAVGADHGFGRLSQVQPGPSGEALVAGTGHAGTRFGGHELLGPSSFVASVGPAGVVTWLQTIVETTSLPAGLVVGPGGETVVGGAYEGSGDLAPDDGLDQPITGGSQVLAGVGAAGSVLWGLTASSRPLLHLAPDGAGGVVAAAIDGGWRMGGPTELPFPGVLSLAHVGADGTLRWAREGAAGELEVLHFERLASGELRMFARVAPGATFGDGAARTPVGPGFVSARFGPDGGLLAASAILDERSVQVWTAVIGTTEAGDFVVAGGIPQHETVRLGEGTPSEVSYTARPADIQDAFVASFDAAGALRWARRVGGPSFEFVMRGALRPSGEVVAVGLIEGGSATLEVEPGRRFRRDAPSGRQGANLLLLRYAPDGRLLAARVESGDDRHGLTHALQASVAGGSFLVAGELTGQVVFGRGQPNETVLTSDASAPLLLRYALDPLP